MGYLLHRTSGLDLPSVRLGGQLVVLCCDFSRFLCRFPVGRPCVSCRVPGTQKCAEISKPHVHTNYFCDPSAPAPTFRRWKQELGASRRRRRFDVKLVTVAIIRRVIPKLSRARPRHAHCGQIPHPARVRLADDNSTTPDVDVFMRASKYPTFLLSTRPPRLVSRRDLEGSLDPQARLAWFAP